MAKKVITTTEFIDDLDGGKAEGTVTFTFQGTSYEIDLNKRNRTGFEKAIKPYIDAARKVRAAAGRGAVAKTPRPASRKDLAEIRGWAKDHGYEVSERGRIAASITQAYDAAQSA